MRSRSRGVIYYPASDIDRTILSMDPLRVELNGRRFIRSGRTWRVFVEGNETHNHRRVSDADAAYLDARFPRDEGRS